MNRSEATELVKPHVTLFVSVIDLYPDAQGVAVEKVASLLGNDLLAVLLRDPIRRQGPRPGYIYPWNVIDYLDDNGPLSRKLKEFRETRGNP